ncbi:helix-turn-helix domain-containing protein, partial [Lactobacillus helveticus]|uniref:helix-turn-helix domain-containing protein n=1 Tax=Lactobacillus helveticus TaxID=1587 RepID=UPI001562651D
EARQYRQLTITKLAEKVNVSKQMISKYERENASPGLDVVQKIIKALDFPLEFFTRYDKLNFSNEGTFFRSRLTATQAEFPELFNRETKSRSPRNAAIELRNLWELGDQPISNMIRLLESHGIIVSISNSNSSKVDANSGYIEVNDHRYYIILIDSNSRSFYRQQFSLAHELGHF